MKVTFLGTGTSTGIPTIGCKCEVCLSDDPMDNRTRTSVFIEVDNLKLVIDTGPDFRLQLLREGIEDIDAVLFTHSHKDHIAGLDDIRPINYIQQKEIEVFASKQTINRLKAEYHYIFAKDYPGVPLIQINEINDEPFQIQSTNVNPIQAMHGKMPVLGFRIKDFTYLTDVNSISTEALQKINGSKVFVLDALHHKKHYSHFTLEEALEIIKKVDVEKTYLIHMSHFMGKHKAVEAELPQNVSLSYDGLKLEI